MSRLRAAGIALLLFAGNAACHTLSVAHVEITVPANDGNAQIEVDLALRDIALSLPLDANRDDKVSWGELLAQRESLENLVGSGLTLSSSGGPCQMTLRELATRRYDDGAYANLRFDAHCPAAGALQLDYHLFFAQDPQHRALVTVRRSGSVFSAIARANATRLSLPIAGGSPFLDFLGEGLRHILSGYDHLAFLVSLLLPAVLLRRDRHWQPSPDFRASMMHVFGIVTAFTVAHSITLSLAALGWVRPASRWIEVAIAASVLLAALNNLWPLVTRRLWLVAFGFGLVHGFGFAGALLEMGLPTGARLAALLGFNVGVELGQLAVVLLLLPLLFGLRRRPWYPRLVMGLISVLIGLLASYWLFRRLSG